MFGLVSALSVPVARAGPDSGQRLECVMEADVVWDTPPYWTGTLAGDLSGTIVLIENPATFPGKTEHFDENFVITMDGVVIKGFDLGVWNLKTCKFRANGMVTESSNPDWEWLVGYYVHFMGVTSPLDIGGPMHATATVSFMPP